MTPSRYFWNGALALLLLIAAGPSHQHTAGQHNSPSAGRLLEKSAGLAESNLAGRARPDVAIRLYDLLATDFINIRPGGARLAASAGALTKTLTLAGGAAEPSYRSFPIEAVTAGPALPETSLEVGPAEISFVRPSLPNNTVFLDIEVPRGARIQVFVDGVMVLRASLQRPLSFHNQEWGEGETGIPGTTVRAAMPLIRRSAIAEQPVLDRSSGSYFVPFSLLQVVKKTPVAGQPGQSVTVVLQIDETGRVIKVTPMTDSPPANLEKIIREWQFVPYEIDGRAVSITTTVRLGG